VVYGNYKTHIQGDKLECSKYKAVTLLNVTYKRLSGILYNRLTKYAEGILGYYQRGYRVNRSTTDHIFTIRQTQEKAYQYNIHIDNLFMDFKQAFDSNNRECYMIFSYWAYQRSC